MKPQGKKPESSRSAKQKKTKTRGSVMTELNDALTKVTVEANGIFDKMRAAIEEQVAGELPK